MLSADDGVEQSGPRHLRQVATVLVQRRRLGFRGFDGRLGHHLSATTATQHAHHSLPGGPEVHVEIAQRLRRDALALADEREQQMLGPDVLMMQDPRLLAREFEDSLRPGRPLRLLHGGAVAPARDVLLNMLADSIEIDGEFPEHRRRHALSLSHYPEEEVLRAKIVVVETRGLLTSEVEHPPHPRREIPLSVHCFLRVAVSAAGPASSSCRRPSTACASGHSVLV